MNSINKEPKYKQKWTREIINKVIKHRQSDFPSVSFFSLVISIVFYLVSLLLSLFFLFFFPRFFVPLLIYSLCTQYDHVQTILDFFFVVFTVLFWNCLPLVFCSTLFPICVLHVDNLMCLTCFNHLANVCVYVVRVLSWSLWGHCLVPGVSACNPCLFVYSGVFLLWFSPAFPSWMYCSFVLGFCFGPVLCLKYLLLFWTSFYDCLDIACGFYLRILNLLCLMYLGLVPNPCFSLCALSTRDTLRF